MNPVSLRRSEARPVQARPVEAPWYRHPLVWLVILLPASSVVAGLSTLAVALKNADDTVADNWYREGRTINRTMADEQQARRLGLSVALDFSTLPHATLHSDIALPWPQTLNVSLRHPTVAARDQQITLHHQGQGEYLGQQALTPESDMIVTVTPADGFWRLQQRARLEDRRTLIHSAPEQP